MSSPNDTSSPSTTIKIICSRVGCERWESLLAQSRLLGLVEYSLWRAGALDPDEQKMDVRLLALA
jgi:hypothetical protein